MRSRVTYEQSQRDIAKRENKCLATIQITGKGGKGGITLQGPVNAIEVGQIHNLLSELIGSRRDAKRHEDEKEGAK